MHYAQLPPVIEYNHRKFQIHQKAGLKVYWFFHTDLDQVITHGIVPKDMYKILSGSK